VRLSLAVQHLRAEAARHYVNPLPAAAVVQDRDGALSVSFMDPTLIFRASGQDLLGAHGPEASSSESVYS